MEKSDKIRTNIQPTDEIRSDITASNAHPVDLGVHPTSSDQDTGAGAGRLPTVQAYGEFIYLYEHFNQALFGGELPPCIITFRRRRGNYGYFVPEWWVDKSQDRFTDEIGLNPFYFTEPFVTVAQTLGHEMAHLWQEHFGNPGRGGYHNVEWGNKMRSIGLMPSHTGAPGGRKTGDQMMDYVIEGGPFDRVCRDLIAGGFEVTWRGSIQHFVKPGSGGGGHSGDAVKSPLTSSGKRTKFTCPKCRLNAWAKSSALFDCRVCGLPMHANNTASVRALRPGAGQ